MKKPASKKKPIYVFVAITLNKNPHSISKETKKKRLTQAKVIKHFALTSKAWVFPKTDKVLTKHISLSLVC